MSTTVLDAITGILNALGASPDLTGTTISDGPPIATTGNEIVIVGYGGDNDTSVIVQTQPEGLGNRALETYSVLCAVSVNNGSDLVAARVRAYALYDACANAISADPTLSGAVMRAIPVNATLRQARTSRGATATLTFSVSVEAFT